MGKIRRITLGITRQQQQQGIHPPKQFALTRHCTHHAKQQGRFLPKKLGEKKNPPPLTPTSAPFLLTVGNRSLVHSIGNGVEYFTHELDPEKEVWVDKDKQNLWELIWKSQFDRPCNRVLQFDVNDSGSGLGSRFMTMSALLHQALEYDRRFTFLLGGWDYADPMECPERSHTCYFVPLSNCKETYKPCHAFSGYSKKACVRGNQKTIHSTHNKLLGKFKHRGKLWYYSNILYFLLQPNEMVKQSIAEAKRILTWKHPIMGIHIRHGDKSSEAKLLPMKMYMEKAECIKSKYNVTKIFLSSDDEGVIKESKLYSNFTFYHLDFVRLNSTAKEAMRMFGPKKVAITALIDLFLLIDCDYLIGTFSSNWSRAAFKMMYAAYGKIPPFIALDGWSKDPSMTRPLEKEITPINC